MAYLPQNPQDLQKQLDSQVLGQSSQGQQPQQQQAPVGGASQPSTIEGSQPGQAPQAPAPKKASSGQFTNLKSYLQASQGAGQKIGQQLTGGMQRQAQQIGQAVQQQKAQYQAQVGQQEAARAQAGQEAQKVLQRVQGQPIDYNQISNEQRASQTPNYSQYIAQPELDYIKSNLGDKFSNFQEDLDTAFRPRMFAQQSQPTGSAGKYQVSPEQQALLDLQQKQERDQKLNDLYKKYNIDTSLMARQAYSVSPEELAKFRELATGQKTFKDVQDMNLTAQQVAQQQLAQKAENLKTFEGRAGQLRETFGKQRQYGSGSAALDNLLLQSQGLPETLTQATGITQGAKQTLKGAEQFSRDKLAGLLSGNEAFAKGLQSQAEGAQTGVISALDQLRTQRAAERAAQLQQEINPLLTKEQQELADLEKYYSGQESRQRLLNSMEQRLGKGGLDASLRHETLTSLRNEMRSNPKRAAEIQQILDNPNALNSEIERRKNQFLTQGTGFDVLARNSADWDWRVLDVLQNTLTGKGSQVDANTLKNLGASEKDINEIFNRQAGNAVNINLLNQFLGRLGQTIQTQRTNLPKALSEELKKASGYGFEDYTTAKDLTRESVASDADRARYAALSALAGKQDAKDLAFSKPTEAKAGRDLSRDELRTLLAKLSDTYGRAGSSVAGTAPMGNTVVK